MRNSLLIRTEASYSINFLIYLQNLFLNQKNHEQKSRFPYMPSKRLTFVDHFEFHFKELWDEVSQRLAKDCLVDLKVFHGEKELFYRKLFVDSDENLNDYYEIHQVFDVWASSLAGRFAIEKSVDGERLYDDLDRLLSQQGMSPQREVHISAVYDTFPLGNTEVFPYFVIVSIEEFLGKYQTLLAKLQSSIS